MRFPREYVVKPAHRQNQQGERGGASGEDGGRGGVPVRGGGHGLARAEGGVAGKGGGEETEGAYLQISYLCRNDEQRTGPWHVWCTYQHSPFPRTYGVCSSDDGIEKVILLYIYILQRFEPPLCGLSGNIFCKVLYNYFRLGDLIVLCRRYFQKDRAVIGYCMM